MLALYLSLIDDLDAKQIFENIYNSHRATIYHIADCILHDHHHSEDAVHEAFIRIIGKIEKISKFPCHKMRSFLVIIVRNIAIDFLRSNSRYVEADLADFQEYLVDDQHDAEQTAQDNEYRQSISKVISQLPAIYLDVLTLTLNTFFVGFFNKSELQSVLQTNLKNNYNIDAKNIELTENQSRAETLVQIYQFTDASGEYGSLAVALIDQPNLNKYKLTGFAYFSQKPSANTSGKLLASGYINTDIYDISDQHLKYFDTYNSINWVTTVIVFFLVLAGGIIGILINKRQLKSVP